MRSHSPFEPIATKFRLRGPVGDMITDAKFFENQFRGFGVTGPPSPPPKKRHFLYLMLIALTSVLALPCCAVIGQCFMELFIDNAGTFIMTHGV